jgi:EXS family
MISAPFFHVGFADFWLADQLNSLVTALMDFQFLLCFYITNGNWVDAVGEYDICDIFTNKIRMKNSSADTDLMFFCSYLWYFVHSRP